MAFLKIRKMDYESAREFAMKALSINTYDPAANFAYGLANVATNRIVDAQDAFGMAAASIEYRSASFTELAKLYYRKNELKKSFDYAQKAVIEHPKNIDAWQIISMIHRTRNEKEQATIALNEIAALNPLSHFVNAEKLLWGISTSQDLAKQINQEMPDEIFLSLADWYQSVNRYQDALTILKLAPQQAEILYWQAFLLHKLNDSSFTTVLTKADQLSPTLVFPYRISAATVMEWAIKNSTSWKPKYFLALIEWNAGNIDKTKSLLQQCGSPDFVPLYAAKASLFPAEEEQNLIKATQLDKNEWRYGKLLVNHYLNAGNASKALTVAIDYQKRFPNNDGLSFLLARCYLLNKQYANSLKVLTGKTFLPNEGATEGRQLFRESWLMIAFDNLEKKKYSSALSSIEKARQWPENLGVGKPYDADIDDRFENFLQAVSLEQMNKKQEADKLYASLASEKLKFRNANLLINAYALRKTGREEDGTNLLESWHETSTDKATSDWCLTTFKTNVPDHNLPANTDQFRLLERLSNILRTKK
jgi:tetratricopeptide (TPR) repeat protein